MIKNAMIMAAGLGTRMRPFTNSVPKPLLPILGVPMLELVLEQLVAAGCEHAVVNVHHLGEQVMGFLRDWESRGRTLRITVSDERKLLLGNAGGVAKALPHFRGKPFYLLNADVLQGFDLSALAEAHSRRRAEFGAMLTLAILKASQSHAYRELECDDRGVKVLGVGEIVKGCRYFASAAVVEPAAYAHLPTTEPSDFLTQVLEPWLGEGRVGAWEASGPWFDLGEPKLWAEAHFELMRLLESETDQSLLSPHLSKLLRARSFTPQSGIWIERAGSAQQQTIEGIDSKSAPLFVGARVGDARAASHSVLYSSPSDDGLERVISWGPHETVFA